MLLIHINFRWLNCFLIRYPYRYQFYESTRFGIVAGLRGGGSMTPEAQQEQRWHCRALDFKL